MPGDSAVRSEGDRRQKLSPFKKESPRDSERDRGVRRLKGAPLAHQLKTRQGRNGFSPELSGKHTSKPPRAGVGGRGGGERERLAMTLRAGRREKGGLDTQRLAITARKRQLEIPFGFSI